ncbi:MAG: transcription elongation factor GreA [Candidatus Blackburnbacteria bacterium]|nr:transcription elongation factor GreA [Candidatus Blackburnbacteria bacterium]
MKSTNHNHNKVQLTRAGFEDLKNELKNLVEAKRPVVVERLSNARSMGDLSENSDYHQAKEELEFVDGQISELQTILSQAKVIKRSNGSSQVGVGSKVKVKAGRLEHIFHIVGEWEADPKEKKISHESPLGKALVGRKIGDKVEVKAPVGKVAYEILAIN